VLDHVLSFELDFDLSHFDGAHALLAVLIPEHRVSHLRNQSATTAHDTDFVCELNLFDYRL
jgi:hypothetical protein